MRPTTFLLPLLSLLAVAAACGGGGGGDPPPPDPNVVIAFNPANFPGGAIDNPFMPLTPGVTSVHEGTTDEGFEHIETTVTATTKTILGVVCVEVHDVAFIDGELVEDTLDWYAQDADGNVWYFGEATTAFEGGVPVSTEGSWEAGVDGALPGIVMLASPRVGDVYQQEDAPGVAEDRGWVVGLGESETVPYGSFTGCLHTKDFSPLEPGVMEDKFYAPGVGLILEIDDDDNRIELISVTGP